jgi:hypothetical protein
VLLLENAVVVDLFGFVLRVFEDATQEFDEFG